MNLSKVGLLAGPIIFLILVLMPAPAGMSYAAQVTAAITLWIAVWWITEPVNSAVTSLLPLVLFPLAGILPLSSLSGEYGSQIIFLFLAGFFLGKTIEKWNLHRRIALSMVSWIGTSPSTMVLGFMVATALVSMWISNTATAIMMTPVAIAVSGDMATKGPKELNFSKALLLGVGYACSIGGLATIIGTPTNAIFVTFAEGYLGETVSFWKWFILGFPISMVLLFICWRLLVRMFPLPDALDEASGSRAAIKASLKSLGSMKVPEKRLLLVFGAVVFSWVTGSIFWYNLVPNCNDTVVAVAGAILLFVIPSGAKASSPDGSSVNYASYKEVDPLLDWATALKIPWGILLLFGGGMALAKGFDVSGLADWLGEQLKALDSMPHIVILFFVLIVVVALSEVASNIATASMMMPVLAALAVSIGAEPFGLCMSATMAASIGFGLPVATAPNSIVYASGHLSTRDMARAGFLLDILCVLVLLAFIYLLFPLVWG